MMTMNTDEMLEADRRIRAALGAMPNESIRQAAGRVAVEEPRGTRRHLLAKEILFGEGGEALVFLRAARLAAELVAVDGGRR